jgi:hypothetical protein
MPSVPALLHHFGTRPVQRGFMTLNHLGQFGTDFVGLYGLFVAHCFPLLMFESLIIIEEIDWYYGTSGWPAPNNYTIC